MFVILVDSDSDCSQKYLDFFLFRTLLHIPSHLTGKNVLTSYEGFLKEVVIFPATIMLSTKRNHWILQTGEKTL